MLFNSKTKFLKTFLLTVFFTFSSSPVLSQLLSYQSEYEVELGNSEVVRVPGKTYVDKASGQLFIDWINNCNNSWVSNQRMVTRFINSHGVGTLSEINYSVNESIDGNKMDFVLEIKEDAELVDRTIGEAIKAKKVTVNFPRTDKEKLFFPEDVIFPHTFLKEVSGKLDKNQKIITHKVYEGTIPNNFFNISVFFTDETLKESNVKLPNKINNNFKKIRMSYYKGSESTPIFEQTVQLNEQGIANYFKYDYPDYSLIVKLKKISLVKLNCD